MGCKPRGVRGTLGCRLLPLGDLAGLLQTWVQVETLIVQQPPERHVGQLLHDLEHLVQVQEHGEVPLLVLGGDADGVRQKDVGCPLQPLDINPRDDKFN